MNNQRKDNPSLRGLFDKVLDILEGEIQKLPDTLSQVTPERRLDFISKTSHSSSNTSNPGRETPGRTPGESNRKDRFSLRI